jgi:DNA-directed RNA polymerase specialized sigma24 family protein
MRKRNSLHCERLEPRDLPAGSYSVPVFSASLASAAQIETADDLNRRPDSGFTAQAAPLLGVGVASARPGNSSLSSEAVGAFFAKYPALGELFPGSPRGLVDPFAVQAGDDDPGTGELAPAAVEAGHAASDRAFWDFLRNYANKAIRREERMRGPLADHADIIQQIYVEWREDVPPGNDVHTRLLDANSTERVAFRSAVRRVLDRSRYDDAKQRRLAAIAEHEVESQAAPREWVDLEIDLALGVGRLTFRQRRILDLRRAGMTFDDIGKEIGLPKQRVFEEFTDVIERLTAIYSDC